MKIKCIFIKIKINEQNYYLENFSTGRHLSKTNFSRKDNYDWLITRLIAKHFNSFFHFSVYLNLFSYEKFNFQIYKSKYWIRIIHFKRLFLHLLELFLQFYVKSRNLLLWKLPGSFSLDQSNPRGYKTKERKTITGSMQLGLT